MRCPIKKGGTKYTEFLKKKTTTKKHIKTLEMIKRPSCEVLKMQKQGISTDYIPHGIRIAGGTNAVGERSTSRNKGPV